MSYVSPRRLERFWDDAKTWIAGKYEPKIIFDDTPVYSVTLAEDIESPYSSPYAIPISPGMRAVKVVINSVSIVSATTPSIGLAVSTNGNHTQFGKVLSVDDGGWGVFDCCIIRGELVVWLSKFSGFSYTSNPVSVQRSQTEPVFVSDTELITNLNLYYVGSNTLFGAGTTITVYAAKEA